MGGIPYPIVISLVRSHDTLPAGIHDYLDFLITQGRTVDIGRIILEQTTLPIHAIYLTYLRTNPNMDSGDVAHQARVHCHVLWLSRMIQIQVPVAQEQMSLIDLLTRIFPGNIPDQPS